MKIDIEEAICFLLAKQYRNECDDWFNLSTGTEKYIKWLKHNNLLEEEIKERENY